MRRKFTQVRSAATSEAGVTATELAIVLPILLLMFFGIVEFGHGFYIQHAINNAAREGARAGVVYQLVPGTPPTRRCGQVLKDYVTATVNTYLKDNTQLPDGTWWVDFPDFPGTCEPPWPLKVQVTARKDWLVLGGFVPGLPDHVDIKAQTTMNFE